MHITNSGVEKSVFPLYTAIKLLSNLKTGHLRNAIYAQIINKSAKNAMRFFSLYNKKAVINDSFE